MVGVSYGGALALALGYCLGSIPFGLVLTRLLGAGDLRSIGSGNIGATNVLRTGRKGLAAATLALDALKATLAVVLAWWAFGPPTALAAAAGAVFGHIYPVWLKFRGGKGVATYLGGLIGLAWPAAIVFAVVWLAVAALTRYSSAAALAATIASPIAMAAIGEGRRGGRLRRALGADLVQTQQQRCPPSQWLRVQNRAEILKGMANKLESRLTDQQRFDWLRLVRSENVGPRTFRALITNCGGARAALNALPDLARRGGATRPIRVAPVEEIEKELIAARKLGVRFVALGEPDYPPALRQIDSAPPVLALRGRAEALSKAAVAIVGSRNASAAGLTFAERLARGLGQAGYVIVSGLARGIDQRAHLASVETCAVGVLAGGHGKPYPSEAVPLMERMIESGAILSEMPVEWEPRGRDFPRRNRIVSGLALGVVVVEAARGSGSLITARFALDQNRQVFAVPGSPLDPRAEGTNDLLKQGASICTSVDDVVTALEPVRSSDLVALSEAGRELGEPLWGEQALYGVDPELTPRTRHGDEFDDASGAPYRTGDEAEAARDRIIALLGLSPITLDELVRAAESSARAVRVALLELELAGRVEYSGDRVALRAAAHDT